MKKKSNISNIILKKLANKQVVSLDDLQQQIIEPKKKYAISRSVKNLISDGFIECLNSDNKTYFRLTQEGKNRLNNIAISCESTLVSTKWDGYWRIIILDLPEERKNEREALRYLLKKAGFICIKNSVWISMFPFENLFNNIKKDLDLTTELMIVVADKIDEKTKKEFLNICKIK